VEKIELFLVADIFKFQAHMRSITGLKMLVNIAEGSISQTNHAAGMEFLVEVSLGKSIKGKPDISTTVLPGPDGIGFGQQMSFIAVTQNEPVSCDFLSPVYYLPFCGLFNLASGRTAIDSGFSIRHGKVETFKKSSEI